MDELKNEALADLVKTLNDKGGLESFVQDIVKATNNATGFSSRQSLADQVGDITKRNTPIFDMLPRAEVVNPIHQWDAIVATSNIGSYAGPIDSVGVDSDPTIVRYSESIKYYRTTTTVGQFTESMSRPQLPATRTVDQKAIEAIKYDIEDDLWQGGNAGDNIRGINDIIANLAPGINSIAQGSALSSTANVDIIQRRIVEQGGLATHIYCNAADRIAFKNIFTNFVRYNDPQLSNKNRFGYTVQTYLSPFGEVDIMYDQFIADKSGAPAASNMYILDITSLALGEPNVNGASGIAMQDLAKTGPQWTKLLNYYGLLIYWAPAWLARLTDVR